MCNKKKIRGDGNMFLGGSTTGYRYLIQGRGDVEEYAVGVMELIEVQTKDYGILDVKVIKEDRKIEIISLKGNKFIDNYIRESIGEILEKERIKVYSLRLDHLEKDLIDEVKNIVRDRNSYIKLGYDFK